MKVYTLMKISACNGGTWCDNTIELIETSCDKEKLKQLASEEVEIYLEDDLGDYNSREAFLIDSGYEIKGYDLIDRKILEDKIYAGVDYGYHLELSIQTWEV